MSPATRVLTTTWRRQGRVFGPVLRDMFGVEVSYVRVLEEAGALPYLAPQPGTSVTAADVLAGFDGLMLIGGEDLAAEVSGAPADSIGANADACRDRWEIDLLTTALESGLPVLAVCRGLQLLNVAFGGTLHGDISGTSENHPPVPEDLAAALSFRHPVDLAPGSRIRSIVGTDAIETNSLHHQSIDRVGHGLEVTGRAADGVVEALETARSGSSLWCVGIQWHPELMADDPHQRALVDAFVDATTRRSA